MEEETKNFANNLFKKQIKMILDSDKFEAFFEENENTITLSANFKVEYCADDIERQLITVNFFNKEE